MSLVRLSHGHAGLSLEALLRLMAQAGNLLQLLNRRLMALQRRLNHLSGSLFPGRQFLKTLGVLLLLLQKLLVVLAGLVRLVDQLLDDLLALVNLLRPGGAVGFVHGWVFLL